jgi:probable rRNA maturation factor
MAVKNKMEILIDNRQNLYPIDEERIRKKTENILDALECPDGELSIRIADDSQIAALNKAYLGRSGPTNVMAFPMQGGHFDNINPYLLGDVVISIETAVRESKVGGMTIDERFYELLIHGILHLFGFDHEGPFEEAERMEAKERELKNLL